MTVSSPILDLTVAQRVHIVAVGGAAMNGIATLLVGMGHQVSGSDLRDSSVLDRLRALGVGVVVGHDAANVGDADVVIASTAVPAHNPEVTVARERGIPVLRRADAQAAFTALRRTIGVAGSHGKTTTSSMLAVVLVEAGFRPSYLVGGELHAGSSSVWSDGEWLVIEADESDGTFLELGVEAAVVTSVEPDHLEHHGGWEGLRAAFARYLVQAPGPRIVCADDPEAARLAALHDATTYGTSDGADVRLIDLVAERSRVAFTLVHGGDEWGRIDLPTAGVHNARNAAAAVTTAVLVGAPFEAAATALARYTGVARRFQHRGEAGGVDVVEDFAHLPGEVELAIGAARNGWDRVVVLFQPHRYSRTATVGPSFGDAFEAADEVVITDVYAADEIPLPGVTGAIVADAVRAAHPETRLHYVPDRREWVRTLTGILRPGDVCLVLGAGDVNAVVPDLLADLAG